MTDPSDPSDEAHLGGARYCDEHERLECTAKRNKGRGICHGPAIRGTCKCRIHSGRKTAVAQVQGEAVVTAWALMGAKANIDYRVAVLAVLQMTWLRLGAYSELLRQQVVLQGGTSEPIDQGDGNAPNTSGLIGYKYGAAGRDGAIYAQSEEIRALVKLEADERDRVVRYSKAAHDMGISERLTSVAERWGDMVAGRLSEMLVALELTPEQQERVPELMDIYLSTIDLSSMEAINNSRSAGVKS